MKNKLNLIINFTIFLLILDVITTFIAFSYGGIEQNVILLWLSIILNISIKSVVILTHIIAIFILIGIKKYYKKKDEVKKDILLYSIIVMLIYFIVVTSNIIQIIKILI